MAWVKSGRTVQVKGLDIFFQVAERLPDCEFLVIGIEPQQRQALVDRYHPPGNVRLEAPRPRDSLAEVYQGASVYLQLSRTEGLPNVLLEAAAAGVPVVATNVGGTAEVVQDGRTGLLVSSGNPRALSNGILRLLGDDSLRSRIKETAPSVVISDFSFGRQARDYCELFRSLLPPISSPAFACRPQAKSLPQ